jgi:hypothetical protein
MPKIDKARIERAARIYPSNQDAGLALGIAPGSFSRLCRHYGIETPPARQRRRRTTGHPHTPPKEALAESSTKSS